jgi:RNA polymerase sigma-70 factor, ECF subfamily
MTLRDEAETEAASQIDSDVQFKSDLIALIPYLRAFSCALCGRRDLAEDIAQEALAKAWKSRRSYQAGTNLKAWLFTILRNENLSYQRRAWRQVAWDPKAGDTIPAAPGQQRWAAELSDVRRALFRVPIEQREALMLVAAAGFSYEEAATIANAPIGTLKSRVARARAKLVDIMNRTEAMPKRVPPAKGTALEQFLAEIPQGRFESAE